MAVAVAHSSNEKTGDVIQTYIIRSDTAPQDAANTGSELSVCGSCPHRGTLNPDTGKVEGRGCYVLLWQGPRIVWDQVQAHRYPRVPLSALSGIGRGRVVRLGTYGDPAAVPIEVWDSLLSEASGWTGYTHQWKAPKLRDALKYCQASVDTPKDLVTLNRRAPGAGYYRIMPEGGTLLPGEILCPSNSGVKCINCQLCDGSGWRIANPAHGAGKSHLKLS